jgi:hypothetical protein
MRSIHKAIGMVLAVTVLLAGCGGSTVNKTVNAGSVGKELEDLKKAYDLGAINQAEYNQARARILNQR